MYFVMKRANRKIKYLDEIKLNANIQNSRKPKDSG
jgi:hypothetical protein